MDVGRVCAAQGRNRRRASCNSGNRDQQKGPEAMTYRRSHSRMYGRELRLKLRKHDVSSLLMKQAVPARKHRQRFNQSAQEMGGR